MDEQLQRLSRRLVNLFLASAIVWPISVVSLHASTQANLRESMQATLRSLFGSAPALGTACLNSLPSGKSSLQQLAGEILAVTSCDVEAIKSKELVRQRIANQVRRDFAQGAILSVDGWLLSLTEVRIYALLALSSVDEAAAHALPKRRRIAEKEDATWTPRT